jgi:threonine dehydratase
MPAGAPQSKIDATKAYGAAVEFIPRDEMFAAMNDNRFNARPGFVHPFDDPLVVAGHGTIGLEILEDRPEVDTVLVPVGSGGLLIGIAVALKAARPDIRVLGVQPEGASGFAASFAEGQPRTTQGTTFVDGAGAPFVMDAMFPTLMQVADGCLTVTDDETRDAIRLLANKNKLIAEGAGALSVAAALKLDPATRGRTVCIISGGSIDPASLAEILTD